MNQKTSKETQDILDLLHESREERDAQLMLAVKGEQYFREVALNKGVDWDALTDKEKTEFVNEHVV